MTEGCVTIIDKAISLLKDRASKVEFTWHGNPVSAYWVGEIIRIDVKKQK